MFISNAEKEKIFDEIQNLHFFFKKLKDIVETHQITLNALTKISVNKAKLDAEQSSVTVTVNAPHGLRKNGTPKAKPGPKGKKQ